MYTKIKLIAAIACVGYSMTCNSQSLFFHENDYGTRLSKIEDSDNLNLKLTLSTNTDITAFDKIIIRTYGSRKQYRERIHSSSYIPIKQFLSQYSDNAVYTLSFLKKSGPVCVDLRHWAEQ